MTDRPRQDLSTDKKREGGWRRSNGCTNQMPCFLDVREPALIHVTEHYDRGQT